MNSSSSSLLDSNLKMLYDFMDTNGVLLIELIGTIERHKPSRAISYDGEITVRLKEKKK